MSEIINTIIPLETSSEIFRHQTCQIIASVRSSMYTRVRLKYTRVGFMYRRVRLVYTRIGLMYIWMGFESELLPCFTPDCQALAYQCNIIIILIFIVFFLTLAQGIGLLQKCSKFSLYSVSLLISIDVLPLHSINRQPLHICRCSPTSLYPRPCS